MVKLEHGFLHGPIIVFIFKGKQSARLLKAPVKQPI